MAGHEMEPPACLSQLKPKHSIFLSHSGDEKSFVEQLSLDLERMNQSPFFDQNSDCLPKGERFPPFIFKAAEQCQLAVVVLSEGYLRSKWPMLELSAFLKAKKTTNPSLKLFPLFYKLSPSDLDAAEVETTWMKSWKKLVEDGKVQEEEIALWSEAVKSLVAAKNEEMEKEKALKEQLIQGEVEAEDFSKLFGEAVRQLRPFNGLDFKKYGNSEPKYRDAVVDEICRCVPPMMKFDTEKIRGYGRLCKKISSMFKEVVGEEGSSNICNRVPSFLGLYGMGGVGKTTLCQAMCSYFQQKYHGRVCHVELHMDSKEERVKRLKDAIRQLGGFNNKVVEMITTVEQGVAGLKKQLCDQPPVFLAVDNVGDFECYREEARAYLDAGLACGSKVLVTSRSQTILRSMLKERKFKLEPIPRLEEEEAKEVFLSVAAPGLSISSLTPCDLGIVKSCLRQCQFADDGYASPQYHPLVLRALGAYFHEVDEDHNIKKWEVHLREENKLQMSRESNHVNDILGLNYERLKDIQKLIFLDVAFLFNMPSFLGHVQFMWQKWRKWWDEKAGQEGQVSILAELHGISFIKAEVEVKNLQRNSLINESSRELTMHDLYVEFARMLIEKADSKEKGWWVGHVEKSIGHFPEMKRLLVSKNKSELCRVPKNIQECRHLVYLSLQGCWREENPRYTLDLGGLNNLRVLAIKGCTLESIVCSCKDSSDGLDCVEGNEGCLGEMRTVVLSHSHPRSVPFLRHCGNLQFLSLSDCSLPFDFTRGGTLKYLKKLEALTLFYVFRYDQEWVECFEEILRDTSTLENLRAFRLFQTSRYGIRSEDPAIINLGLLKSLRLLSVLSLICLPKFIWELKGLEQLYQLTTLELQYCKGLRKLPDLHLLPNLQQVCLQGCCILEYPTSLLRKFRKFPTGGSGQWGRDGHNHTCLEPQCKSNFCKVCVDCYMERQCSCPNEDGDYCDICKHLANSPCYLKPDYCVSEFLPDSCKLCLALFMKFGYDPSE